MDQEKFVKNEEETRSLGLSLGRSAKAGDIIALEGDLGAGKTTLTKAIAQGLGIPDTITSPTFTIVREYRSGRIPLYHFDVYRIDDPDELYEIGCEEYFYGDGLCVIEWADNISEILPDEVMRITIDYGANEGERIIKCGF